MTLNSKFNDENLTLSDHPHPQPHLYRVQKGLVGLALALIGLAVLGELLLIAGQYPAPLLCPMAVFTAGLALPLWLATVMHPPLTATEAGLIVRPMFGRARLVPWETIRAVRPHTLIPPDEPGRRLLEGRRRYRPREGRWIVVNGTLPILFRLVGLVGGQGNAPVFGISSATHADYEELLRLIEKRLVISC